MYTSNNIKIFVYPSGDYPLCMSMSMMVLSDTLQKPTKIINRVSISGVSVRRCMRAASLALEDITIFI